MLASLGYGTEENSYFVHHYLLNSTLKNINWNTFMSVFEQCYNDHCNGRRENINPISEQDTKILCAILHLMSVLVRWNPHIRDTFGYNLHVIPRFIGIAASPAIPIVLRSSLLSTVSEFTSNHEFVPRIWELIDATGVFSTSVH